MYIICLEVGQESSPLRATVMSDDVTSHEQWVDIVQQLQVQGYREAAIDLLSAVTSQFSGGTRNNISTANGGALLTSRETLDKNPRTDAASLKNYQRNSAGAGSTSDESGGQYMQSNRREGRKLDETVNNQQPGIRSNRAQFIPKAEEHEPSRLRNDASYNSQIPRPTNDGQVRGNTKSVKRADSLPKNSKLTRGRAQGSNTKKPSDDSKRRSEYGKMRGNLVGGTRFPPQGGLQGRKGAINGGKQRLGNATDEESYGNDTDVSRGDWEGSDY